MNSEMHTIVTVDEVEYLVSHPDPEAAWNTGIKLTQMIAEPILGVGLGAGKKSSDKEEDEKKLLDAMMVGVRKLLANVEPGESYKMVKTILSTVEVQGRHGEERKKLVLNTDANLKFHFRGHMGSMIKLVVEVVKFTHSDFFSVVRNGITETMAELKG